MKQTHITPQKWKWFRLSIVSKILHEHNGYISINNAFNDSGANISIVLPKKQ